MRKALPVILIAAILSMVTILFAGCTPSQHATTPDAEQVAQVCQATRDGHLGFDPRDYGEIIHIVDTSSDGQIAPIFELHIDESHLEELRALLHEKLGEPVDPTRQSFPPLGGWEDGLAMRMELAHMKQESLFTHIFSGKQARSETVSAAIAVNGNGEHYLFYAE